jgi:uncharacterized protein (TIRG00374 family)
VSRAGYKVWLRILISTVLIVFLLQKLSITELVDLILKIDKWILTAAVLCFFLSNLLGSYQWHLLLGASGVRLGYGQTFRFYFVGLFFNNFLPANIGGDAVKVYDVTKAGSSVYQVIAVTLLDRLLGIFSLCLLALGATVYLLQTGAAGPFEMYILIFIACMMPALGLYFFKPLGKLLRRLVTMVRPLSLDERMSSILDYLSEFKGRKILVSRLLGLSLVIQTLRVLTHVLIGIALGIAIDFNALCQFFVYVPLLGLAIILPISIAGLGVRESLGILLFANAGITETDAFAMEFLTYPVSVLVSLVGFLFFISRRSAARRGAEPL